TIGNQELPHVDVVRLYVDHRVPRQVTGLGFVEFAQVAANSKKQNKLVGRVTVIVQLRQSGQRGGTRGCWGSAREQCADLGGTREQQEQKIPLVIAAEETEQKGGDLAGLVAGTCI